MWEFNVCCIDPKTAQDQDDFSVLLLNWQFNLEGKDKEIQDNELLLQVYRKCVEEKNDPRGIWKITQNVKVLFLFNPYDEKNSFTKMLVEKDLISGAEIYDPKLDSQQQKEEGKDDETLTNISCEETTSCEVSPSPREPTTATPLYEVEAIIARRKIGRGKQYKVKWKGYPVENTWEPRRSLIKFPLVKEMIWNYELKKKHEK